MDRAKGDVSVRLTGPTSDTIEVPPTSMTFTAENWNVAQTVTITSEADDNNLNYWLAIIHTASGSGYTGQDAIKLLMEE